MSSVIIKAQVQYPFPGLRPFQEGEEHLFFGRESQTDAMIDKLAATRFLTVIGTSGCGKSSLVNCGLCMGLHSGLMPQAGTAWRTATCRPGDNPIASLAKALAQDGVLFDQFANEGMSLSSIIETNLRMSKLGLVDVFEQARLSENTNLLIIIDQFEELFRFQQSTESAEASLTHAREEAAAFVKLLLSACEQQDKRVYIVLTMRSDFLGQCTQLEGLTEAINQGQYLVPRMTRKQRRLAIAGPISVAGASIDDVLLTQLINDLGDNPDQLSILQHALNRIWAHWVNHNTASQPLCLQNYAAVGSMSHALDRHAEKAYAQLATPRQQQVAQTLFKALTDKTSHADGIRRPTSLHMLCELTQCTQDDLIKVIDVFRKSSRSFIMPPIDEALSPDTMIDISHESLMRMWQRLIRWSHEEAVSAQTYRRLAATAELFEQNQAGLWRDPDLQLALQWRHRNEPNAMWASRIAPGYDNAMRFLDDSRAKSDEETEAQLRVAEQSRELEHTRALANEQEQRIRAQKSASKRQQRFYISIIAGLVATLGLGTAFWQQKKVVTEQESVLIQEKTRSDSLIQSVVYKQDTLSKAQDTSALLADAIRFHQTKTRELRSLDRQFLHDFASNSQKINQQVWQLVKSNNLSAYQIPITQPFVNQSNQDYQIYKLNESQGLQSEPVIVPAGTTVMLDGFVNQIWIARTLPDFTVMATGILHEDAESEMLR